MVGSPSVRRVLVEIGKSGKWCGSHVSPSVRRVLVEIGLTNMVTKGNRSPSVRRVLVEMKALSWHRLKRMCHPP